MKLPDRAAKLARGAGSRWLLAARGTWSACDCRSVRLRQSEMYDSSNEGASCRPLPPVVGRPPISVGAKIVSHWRYLTFQMAGVRCRGDIRRHPHRLTAPLAPAGDEAPVCVRGPNERGPKSIKSVILRSKQQGIWGKFAKMPTPVDIAVGILACFEFARATDRNGSGCRVDRPPTETDRRRPRRIGLSDVVHF
jgi:hypothetical protein